MIRATTAARTALLALSACALLAGCGEDEPVQADTSAPTPIVQPSTGQPAPAPEPEAKPEKRTSERKKTASQAKKPTRTADAATPVPIGKGFDFYVLAVLWSPSYCAAEGEDASQQQCSRPYSFAVHGLWPQFEDGFPEDCKTDEPDVPNEMLRSLYDIMPAAGLIRHEWRKHGTCTQLTQADYFKVVRAAWNRITIPSEFQNLTATIEIDPKKIERAFLAANPAMKPNGAAVICDEKYFREVRICMTKDLQFRSCPDVDRRDCRLYEAEMPPVGGG